MSNDPLVQSSIVADLSQDAEYDAVYAAVTATERGRWFLTEYANRNRHADTDMVVGAIARMEAAIRGDPVGIKPPGGLDLSAAAERIADIAFALRERSADADLCDALDAAVRELCIARASPASVHEADGGRDRADEKDFGTPAVGFEIPNDKKVAAAAATLAASFSPLSEEQQTISDAQNEPVVAGVASPQDDARASAAAAPGTADQSPRSYIAPPEFVVQPANRAADGGNRDDGNRDDGNRDHGNRDDGSPNDGKVSSSGQSGEAHPPLREPQLAAGPRDDPAELFEATPEDLAGGSPQPVPEAAPAATQLRVATGSAVRPMPDPLAALRVLSDEELIALFG